MTETAADVADLLEQIKKNGIPGPTTSNATETSRGFDARAWRKKLEHAGIYDRYFPCSFKNMASRPLPAGIAGAMKQAKEYAQHFNEYEKRGVGVIFIGPVGTMKTSMAVGIAQELLRNGRGVMFLPLAELFDNLVRMSKQRDNTEFLAFENRLKETSLLILDDLGTEYPGDWIRNKVDAIISHRYNRLKPICITTNLLPGEMAERYQERVYDRLKGSSLVISVASESMRTSPKKIGE